MQNRILALAAVTSLATSAHATLFTLDLKVSRDAVVWSDFMDDFLVGQTVRCAIFMNSDLSLPIYGVGGATLRLGGTSSPAEDTVSFAPGTATGRVSPFNFGNATNTIYRDTPGTFRIDAGSDPDNNNTAAGMTFFQRDPSSGGPSFSILPRDGIGSMVFAFDILLGSQDVYLTTLAMDQLSRNVVSYYSSSSATRPTSTSDVTLDGASFWVNIPTPGSMVALCLGGLLARRRR
jgi:hypothetical protein